MATCLQLALTTIHVKYEDLQHSQDLILVMDTQSYKTIYIYCYH